MSVDFGKQNNMSIDNLFRHIPCQFRIYDTIILIEALIVLRPKPLAPDGSARLTN